jgi:hypothetical protein
MPEIARPHLSIPLISSGVDNPPTISRRRALNDNSRRRYKDVQISMKEACDLIIECRINSVSPSLVKAPVLVGQTAERRGAAVALVARALVVVPEKAASEPLAQPM